MDKDYRSETVIENHDEGVTRLYKITARNEGQINMLEKVFAHIQYLCRVGSSRSMTIFCDGDGPVSLKFQKLPEDSLIYEELDYEETMNLDSGYGRFEIDDSDGTGEKTYFDLG